LTLGSAAKLKAGIKLPSQINKPAARRARTDLNAQY
jgi:hypothetical protein